MSAIMYERAVDGTTIGLRIVNDSGDEIDYNSGRGLTMAIEDSPIFTEVRPRARSWRCLASTTSRTRTGSRSTRHKARAIWSRSSAPSPC
jgi:hypothetical protein